MSEVQKVILIVTDSGESNTVIGIASSMDKAYILLGKSFEKAPWSSPSSIYFYEVNMDQDFVAPYEGIVGKLLNPKPKVIKDIEPH